ncbi:MAG: tRNA (adenosine(37)-N6)-threonylcarbamoyltransferase complex dimerization subunit type 1 TsaB [Phycisphaera sp.]|nr:MAG: tRNA (adenosine(37)-N6)-threonylcarbamoyltransferase complex dimerization subunit type 1 TsaB [Phycisphaera sp.]
MADLTLAIESSNPSSGGEPGVALGLVEADEVTLLDTEPLGEGERHDDLLMPAIQRLMARAGREPFQLDRIVCSIGPGGYTGLRIATSAANMMALVSGAKLFGVPSAWVAAISVEANCPFGVALASKGESCFLTTFDASGTPQGPGKLARPTDIEKLGLGVLVGDQFLSKAIRAETDRLGLRVIPPEFSAKACLSLAPRAPEVRVGELVPLYGREAEAVTKWRQLHPDSGV